MVRRLLEVFEEWEQTVMEVSKLACNIPCLICCSVSFCLTVSARGPLVHLVLRAELWPVTSLPFKITPLAFGPSPDLLPAHNVNAMASASLLAYYCSRASYKSQSDLQPPSRAELQFQSNGWSRCYLYPVSSSDCSHLAASWMGL